MAKKIKYKKGAPPDPLQVHGKVGDVLQWDPDSSTTSVEITFDGGRSPVREWVSIVGQPGEPVNGTIKGPISTYPYHVPLTTVAAEPEVIVDGGLPGAKKRTRRAAKKSAARKTANKKK
jgi:hypothetical protein